MKMSAWPNLPVLVTTDLDEVDFLEYFGRDPETKVIGIYLESIPRGDRLIEAASRIDKR